MPPKKSLPSGMSAMQLDENAGPTSASKDAKDAARDAIAIEVPISPSFSRTQGKIN
jgi:hypothetical protein